MEYSKEPSSLREIAEQFAIMDCWMWRQLRLSQHLLSRRGAAFTLPQHCFRFCLLVLESLQDLLVSLPVASSTPTYL